MALGVFGTQANGGQMWYQPSPDVSALSDSWMKAAGAWNGGGGPQQLNQQAGIAGLNYGAAMHAVDAPLQYKSDVFSRVFPYMENLVSGLGLAGGGKPNANLIAPTHVTQGGVYNPSQIQQQVNQARAQQDQTTATQIQQGRSQLAGRGFGASSPLAALLGQQAQAQGNSNNAQNETNIRMTAAQQNAGQNLSAQQAQGGINSAWNTAAVQNQTSHYNALIGILGAFGNLM